MSLIQETQILHRHLLQTSLEKVNMTLKEKEAHDYCKRFNNVWDTTIIASDAFLAGFRKVKELLAEGKTGEEQVEVEFKNGSHQLR